MSGTAQQKKPRVVFVDDEQRVLNSMRVRFRREYDLHLTTLGSEALAMLEEHEIDVIVADQRMPEMQGTEVLSKARDASPRTVRILLTGYADLDAIESSINDAEVFRFLTKPCAPEELRETIQQAIDISRDQEMIAALEAEPAQAEPPPEPVEAARPEPAISLSVIEEETATDVNALVAAENASTGAAMQQTAEAVDLAASDTAGNEEIVLETSCEAAMESGAEEVEPAAVQINNEGSDAGQDEFHPPPFQMEFGTSDDDPDAITIVLEGDSASVIAEEIEETAQVPAAIAAGIEDKIGVLVFSEDKATLENIREMLGDRYMVVGAGNIVSVTKLLKATRPGVLVTDISEDLEVIETMVNALKSHLPELVTIVIGEHRDTIGLVNLINYGQIYRFLQKPLAAGTFTMTVKAATQKHLQLKKYPELARRYAVRQKEGDEHVRGAFRSFLDRLRNMSRLWATHS
ncbi:MAG: response regulator [Chromatiales bacterium]|jgi:DNA-binding NtrC family response regulator|nr:response regulator [Chromatiales bacterium]